MAIPPAELNAALERARRWVARDQSLGVPVDICSLAKEMGVHSIQPACLDIDGYLGRAPDGGLIIRYRADNSELRNRFTIAHELGHLILAEVQNKDITRLHRDRITRNSAEEIAVNRIASELLMPKQLVEQEVAKRVSESPWRAITAMRHYFKVSESAMVIRLLELENVAAILIRINLGVRSVGGPTYPVDRSKHGDIRLVHEEASEAERLWREAQRSALHMVAVETSEGPKVVRCGGIVRKIKTKHGVLSQYWVIGWRLRASKPSACREVHHSFGNSMRVHAR
jgi:hypothetical protein